MGRFPRVVGLFWLTVAVAAVVAPTSLGSALGGSGSARVAPGTVRLGAAPALPLGAHIASALPDGTPMRVTVTLHPRDPSALRAFAAAVSTPGSPEYRQYITPRQFARRFGATPAAVKAVEASLRAHGLRPGRVSANSLSIQVSATASRLSRAFSTSFAHVALSGGKTAIVNQVAPAVDSAVAPDIQAVLGLDTLSPAEPLLVRPHAVSSVAHDRPHVATGGPQPCAQATSAASQQGGYTDDEIASAYGLSGLYQAGGAGGTPDAGAGETVAVLELEPYDDYDISQYEQCYGINALFANVPVDGGAGTGPGSGEAALDIENVIGLAPQARVIVYEGPNSGAGPYDTFSAIITQHQSQVVTASWGQCEPLDGYSEAAAESTLFQEAAAQGQSIFSAAGDDGAEDCFPESPSAAVDDPASQPDVTGVGGTTLSAIGPRPTEHVWNDGPETGATGGGVSSFWTMPSYQSAAASALHVIQASSSGSTCGAPASYCREAPDVSADADPATGYMIYWNGQGDAGLGQPTGWQSVGGTSGAAPAWAALAALTNASAACGGMPIGFANPALYNAASTAYSSDFNDVTSGDNDMTGTNNGKFAAGPGYDMTTGLGTPNGAALAGTLCTDSVAVGNPGSQRTILNSSVSLQIEASDSRGSSLSYSASGLPSGLSINAASGKVTGKANKTVTATVTVTAADSRGTVGGTSFQWRVEGNPTVSHVALSGISERRPKLSLTATAGRGAPDVKSINLVMPSGLHFTKSKATVTVTGARGHHLPFTAKLKGNALVLTLKNASPEIKVTISYPRLAASDGLVAAVASRHSSRVTVTVRVTDSGSLTTRLTAKVKPQR
jgi:subtilase family serine protease